MFAIRVASCLLELITLRCVMLRYVTTHGLTVLFAGL